MVSAFADARGMSDLLRLRSNERSFGLFRNGLVRCGYLLWGIFALHGALRRIEMALQRTRYRDYATAQEIYNSGIPGARYLKSIATLVANRSGCTLPEVSVTEHHHAMTYEFEAVFDSRRWTGLSA